MINKLISIYVFNVKGDNMSKNKKIGLLGIAGVIIMAGFAIITEAVGMKGSGLVILYTVAVGGIGYAIARQRCRC